MVQCWRIASSPLLILALCGCDVILDVDEDRSPRCSTDEQDRYRCNGNVSQRCGDDLEWRDEATCTDATPVCSASSGRCESITQVAAGGAHTCAVLSDGTVWCWGLNASGQVGTPPSQSAQVRTPAPLQGISDVLRIQLGGSDEIGHSCALLESGQVSCWGANDAHQLGTGEESTDDRSTPVVVPGIEGASALSLGSHHACAVVAGGRVTCWGANQFGQAGQDPLVHQTVATPTLVDGLDDVEELAAGAIHTCARTKQGAVKCWGSNESGQCGVLPINPGGPILPPREVPGLDGAKRIAAGSHHTCATSGPSGEEVVLCWGAESCGQLGAGITCNEGCPVLWDECSQAEPTQATAGERSFAVSELALGAYHTCTISYASNSVRCWGRNNRFQVKQSDTNPVFDVTQTNQLGALQVSAGGYHTCILTSDGAMVCWGSNEFGQLGSGLADQRHGPARVSWTSAVPAEDSPAP
ncbi:RCC1 domain-containing protein [Sorangium sp. So ce131]|uniref:RCC1 domain-containing protein n=1 Tax=Sorangium sp. So ce131 TaxID=3133282 RepID=UPI003F5EC350